MDNVAKLLSRSITWLSGTAVTNGGRCCFVYRRVVSVPVNNSFAKRLLKSNGMGGVLRLRFIWIKCKSFTKLQSGKFVCLTAIERVKFTMVKRILINKIFK